MQEPDQERDRGQPDHHERRALDRHELAAEQIADVSSTAIITSPRANESISNASERRSGRPVRLLRAASTPIPARHSALNRAAERAPASVPRPAAKSARADSAGPSRRATSSPARDRSPPHRPRATSHRSNRRSEPPAREREETCKNNATGTKSNVRPTVYGTSLLAHCSLDRNVAKPAATISGPRRLSRPTPPRDHPLTMYGSVIHSISPD